MQQNLPSYRSGSTILSAAPCTCMFQDVSKDRGEVDSRRGYIILSVVHWTFQVIPKDMREYTILPLLLCMHPKLPSSKRSYTISSVILCIRQKVTSGGAGYTILLSMFYIRQKVSSGGEGHEILPVVLSTLLKLPKNMRKFTIYR